MLIGIKEACREDDLTGEYLPAKLAVEATRRGLAHNLMWCIVLRHTLRGHVARALRSKEA